MTHHCSENHTCHHHCNANHNVDEEKPKIKFLPYRVDQTPVEYAPGQMIALNISDPTELLITGANDTAKLLLGYEKSDFKNTPTSLKDLVLPSDRAQFNSDVKCLTQKGSEGVLSNPCRVADKNGNPVWFHITIAKLPADSNQSTKWVAFLYNKYTCTLVEQIVDRKITLLRAASNVTKALLVNTDFNTAINESLKILGEASKVDRVYLFDNFTDEHNQPYMRQRFEWISRHAHPEIDNPDLQSLPYSGEYKTWYKKLSLGQTIKGLVKDMPEDIRMHLSHQKIVSIIIVPIIIEEKFWGFVGFDDCLEPREWTQGEQAVIETVSASLGGAIQKEITASHLAESRMKYKSVVDNIEEVVFQTNEKGECIYINDAWKKLSGYSADESLGKCLFEYFDTEHVDFLKNAHKAILHGDKHRIHKEFHLYTITGSKRWVSVTLLPQKDETDTQRLEPVMVYK
jgi:PAS domain S-box-containing protein